MFYVYALSGTQALCVGSFLSREKAHTFSRSVERKTGYASRVTTKNLGEHTHAYDAACAPGCASCKALGRRFLKREAMKRSPKRGARGGLKKACWPGYEAYGFKRGPRGSRVPNCVPKTRMARSPKKMCPVGTKIQTLVFLKPDFTRQMAFHWAHTHGFKTEKVHETEHSFRLRQSEPGTFLTESFRTLALTDGVQAVIGCPRGREKRTDPIGD